MRPRNEVGATAAEVARWLVGEVQLEGPLDPLEVAEELEDLFGPNVFTRTDDGGRLAINRDVVALLEAMARAAGLTEVWLDG
jgi:hypothetical protein